MSVPTGVSESHGGISGGHNKAVLTLCRSGGGARRPNFPQQEGPSLARKTGLPKMAPWKPCTLEWSRCSVQSQPESGPLQPVWGHRGEVLSAKDPWNSAKLVPCGPTALGPRCPLCKCCTPAVSSAVAVDPM